MSNDGIDYAGFLDNLPAVSMRLLQNGGSTLEVQYVSRGVERYGYSRDEFIAGCMRWADVVHPEDRPAIRKKLAELARVDNGSFAARHRLLEKSGKSRWVTAYVRAQSRHADGSRCLDAMLVELPGSKPALDLLDEHQRQQAVLKDILMGLHDADFEKAMRIILDRGGMYLNASRVLLFQCIRGEERAKVVHEWLNHGIASAKGENYVIDCRHDIPEVYRALLTEGAMLVDAGKIPAGSLDEFARQGVVSSATFAVYTGDGLYGFVCYDDCVINRTWDVETAAFLKNITSLISNVLMRMEDEARLKSAQETCETVLDNVDVYIFAVSRRTGRLVFANLAFREVFGEDCMGREAGDFIPPPPESLADEHFHGEETERCALFLKRGKVSYEFYLRRTEQWLAVNIGPVRWVDGQGVYLGTCYDITAKKLYEESISRMAYQDHLTGLPNRYKCDSDLQASIRGGAQGHVLLMDLDDFKIVNDCYGHDYGDGVLVEVAGYLDELFRDNGQVYRLGGDEFVVILPGNDQARADGYIALMLERAKKPWRVLGKDFYCPFSIGVAEFRPGCGDIKSILKKADIAMYQTKKQGKNNSRYYTEGLDSDAMRRSEMESLLRKAVENDFAGFEVYYQPYNDAGSGRILGAEALLRLRAPDGRLLLPEQFIGLAEYLGLMAPLGEHVFKKAAALCADINLSGRPDFSMTVNVSFRQLQQSGVVARMENILRSSGVDFSKIIIGVNEGAAISELETMLAVCSSFRAHGIRVALDNFGSGASSLINMRNLPVDIVKVSSRYIDSINDDFTGYFIRLVTDLCHCSGKAVCVNGVETEEQFSFCRKRSVDMVQGFFLHRPGTVEALAQTLDKVIEGLPAPQTPPARE